MGREEGDDLRHEGASSADWCRAHDLRAMIVWQDGLESKERGLQRLPLEPSLVPMSSAVS
jgi:hypothetical protein